MMKTYKNKSRELQDRIIALENKRKNEFAVLKIQSQIAYQELSPTSLLNRAVTDIKESQNAKGNIFETALSVVGGYLSKKIFVGKSNSLFKSILGYAVQYASTKFISKNIK